MYTQDINISLRNILENKTNLTDQEKRRALAELNFLIEKIENYQDWIDTHIHVSDRNYYYLKENLGIQDQEMDEWGIDNIEDKIGTEWVVDTDYD